jgi:hypothetical protein
MGVKDKKIEKVYSSYVSEYHLEMILVPFINSKIEEKENVVSNNLSQAVFRLHVHKITFLQYLIIYLRRFLDYMCLLIAIVKKIKI